MNSWLISSQIAEIFAEEMISVEGKVTDARQSEGRLFTRGVLPRSVEVAPSDKLKGGVALCATDADIFIHPYVFRVVCTNGAIMATATQTRHISRDNWLDDPQREIDLETTIRAAVRACCQREAFVWSANQMRSAREKAADMAITVAAFMSSHRGAMSMFLDEILRRYDRESDRSSYGLMNAVTSVARDTRDPQMKWRLEEFGGGIPAMRRRPRATPGRRRAAVRSLVEVG